jgi:hypothetical protein
MGSDEKEAVKALKALLAELTPAPDADAVAKAAADKAAADAGGSLSKAEVEKMLADQKAENEKAIADAVKKAMDATPADDAASKAKIFAVIRGGEVKKAEAEAASDPLPV